MIIYYIPLILQGVFLHQASQFEIGKSGGGWVHMRHNGTFADINRDREREPT